MTLDSQLRISFEMMRHRIKHRFQSTFKFTFNCQLCDRLMFFGVKCRDCKYLCHKNCADRAPPSCGLNNEFKNIFAKKIQENIDEHSCCSKQKSDIRDNKEWEIPCDVIDVLRDEDRIGSGNFCSDPVFKGNWYGTVAIKRLVLSNEISNDERKLELVQTMFKEEVANFRNTRHEHLEIFMGVNTARLAIVTTYCQGTTLYDQIHKNKERFTINKIIQIAQQICLGMGYLHSRNIVHKDLKSKNIFVESGQVVITDFGLFSLKRLCRNTRKGPWLSIPKGWLSYLAPEIMRRLDARLGSECSNIEFTFSSDVYAFGTIWYELLACDIPYKNTLPPIVIWQVGRGLKQPLINLQAPREIKNILLICWSSERPNFQELNNLLESLPRKRVQRSSSFCFDNIKF